MQVRHQAPWEGPVGSPGSSGVSGSSAFVASLQTMPRKVPGMELLEQHLGKGCKQHPNNLWERICLGMSTHRTCPAWLWLSQLGQIIPKGKLPRSFHRGHSLVGRSSMSCSRRSVCRLLHQIVKELDFAELVEADKVRAFGCQ